MGRRVGEVKEGGWRDGEKSERGGGGVVGEMGRRVGGRGVRERGEEEKMRGILTRYTAAISTVIFHRPFAIRRGVLT